MTSEVARARGAAHAVAVDRADQSALPRLFPALLLLLKIALMVSLFAPIETFLLYVFYIHLTYSSSSASGGQSFPFSLATSSLVPNNKFYPRLALLLLKL
jgi:hypothetical protein